MPTVVERLQLFYQTTDFRFGRKKFKYLHERMVKYTWDKKNQAPPPYKTIQEEDKTYQIRNYPDSFTPHIDLLIQRLYLQTLKNISEDKAQCKKAKAAPLKPKRKRIPMKQQPIRSFKPSIK